MTCFFSCLVPLFIFVFDFDVWKKKCSFGWGSPLYLSHRQRDLFFILFFPLLSNDNIKPNQKGLFDLLVFLSLFLSFSHFFPLLLLVKSTSELFFFCVIRITNLILFFSFIFFFIFVMEVTLIWYLGIKCIGASSCTYQHAVRFVICCHFSVLLIVAVFNIGCMSDPIFISIYDK